MKIFFLTLILAVGAFGQNTVFGFRLGAKLDLPECGKQDAAQTCYERTLHAGLSAFRPELPASSALPDQALRIHFARYEKPALVTGELLVYVVDQRIELVAFDTGGVKTQGDDLRALKAKYGEPTNVKPSRFTSAYWTKEGLSVNFQSGAETGMVVIRTAAYMSLKNKERSL